MERPGEQEALVRYRAGAAYGPRTMRGVEHDGHDGGGRGQRREGGGSGAGGSAPAGTDEGVNPGRGALREPPLPAAAWDQQATARAGRRAGSASHVALLTGLNHLGPERKAGWNTAALDDANPSLRSITQHSRGCIRIRRPRAHPLRDSFAIRTNETERLNRSMLPRYKRAGSRCPRSAPLVDSGPRSVPYSRWRRVCPEP